jgi:hypothetical protein
MANTNQTSPRLLLFGRRPLQGSHRMNKRHLIAVAVLALLVPSLAIGQNRVMQEEDKDDSASNGRVWGNYTVRQSIEFGGRISENSGNQQMYDTLVNLQSGPRLLGQELSMQSMHHNGSLFDNLYLSSFGLGGDPNDVVRLRIEKNKWYNFVGLYRRDVNFFDYNLFANPLTLNPGITNCSTVVGGAVSPCTAVFNPQASYFYTNSPHLQNTTRNMGDFNLTLFPQSAIRVRLGFSRNNNKGTVDSSLEDVNIDLTQQFQSRSDRWTFGVDVRPLARTTLSFTQFFEHDKVDTAYVNSLQNLFTLGAGGPNVFVPLYFPPCAVIVAGRPQPYITATGVLNPLCNSGVFSYSRGANVRSNFPTSQLSLRSNYFRKLDVTADGTYSSGNSKVLNYDELFHGLVSRTNNTAFQVTGPANTDRVSGNADLGLTYHFSKSWSVSDKFRWLDWRDPGVFNQSTLNCFSNLASGATLSTPTGAFCGVPGITTAGFAPAGLTSSQSVAYSTLEAERSYFNTATLNWTPSRRFNSYVGYRYGRRELATAYLSSTTNSLTLAGGLVGAPGAATVANDPLSTDKINQHTALFGVVLRPTDKWRINADAELTSTDNAFAEIVPRHEQRVRANTVYKVNRWASINGGVHFIESRNNWAENFGGTGVNLFPTSDYPAYGTKSHTRYYTLGASLQPNRRIGLDFGWTYMDQKFSIPACMVMTGASVIAGGAPTLCPSTTNQPTEPAQFNITANQFNVPLTQVYQENTNTGYAILTIRPIHRVTLNLGYEITSTSGYDNWLRADNGLPLHVLGDAFGNVPGIPGNSGTAITGATTSAGTIAFLGPFANQPMGAQDFNWHKLTAGIAVDIAKGVTFKGAYAYYDYNEKEGNVLLNQLVALPRNFHTNTGTVSLRYSF